MTTVKGALSADPDTTRDGRGADAGLRAVIVTIYGLYAREVGGWLSVSTLIRLMAELGVDEPAVRSSISRLKRRGILEAERVDGRAGYALSAQAREILDAGDRRIFHRRRGTLDEGWVLAVFSVPESERRRRHTLRSRLAWLGFGSVGPGVWIAPAHLQAEARDVLVREQLAEYVDLFEASYLGFAPAAEQVRHWWDLQSLDALYQQFCDDHSPVLARWRARRSKDDPGPAFADYVRVLTSWRRLPYLDPGLAPELLPRDWSGTRAADLFFALQRRLERPSHAFVEQVR
ncbi:PaaX family transcriptional regulator [Ornithinimicrobium cerasi]|uniref:Transcriptional regulator, PaaX family n=1 Tax=Ornithinimicrobium cerasi TaxID=2248773 RepID=A0A285VHU9_9MICO|nr:PaaX family transcriptional regulator C-terminal domain-containing protein [Ornithinimicrobium cerasi]SOC53655.1 transcriptional regulator, PaaX family [Ornithinimicrobium cerasi]